MILAVVGPTGVGKTKLSVELARKFNAIIINADAMQVYKKMDVGTAKVTESEKKGVPHFLFDIVDPKINYTVFDYQKDARRVLEENKDKNIIFAGGTGLYLKAALYNYVFKDEDKTRNKFENYSNDELYNLALKKDPNMDIHKNNRKRLVRFLNKEEETEEECYPLYDVTFIGLTTDRDTLYQRIDERVDEMFENGLLEEVKELYRESYPSKALTTAIGYKELIEYLKGNITLEESKELIKKNSRHYAKRQYTWFNNQMNVNWFNVDLNNFNNTMEEVIKFINNIG